MLETAQSDRQNRKIATIAAIVVAVGILLLCLHSPYWLLAIPLPVLLFRWLRRRTVRRLKLIHQPIRPEIETALIRHVAYYRSLDETGKKRFGNLVKVFLDETPITGIRTDVDATTQALVAASAVIPIFGFEDWEYSGLGEVLIYPGAFDDKYGTEGDNQLERRTLGMVGVGNLSGVMILSKPDLLSGFDNPEDKRNVGIHEFAHLVDKADGSVDGLPAGMSLQTMGPWIQWVGHELKNKPDHRTHIDSYAYTNEAEYFAVLSEYFFEAPDVLNQKAPKIYEMMQSMYHQNTQGMFHAMTNRPKRVGRNSPCPCGSGKKYKQCCRRRAMTS